MGNFIGGMLVFVRRYILTTIILLITNTAFSQNDDGYVSGKVRVKLLPNVELEIKQNLNTTLSSVNDIVITGNTQLDALNKRYQAVKMKRVFPYAGKHEYKHVKHGLHLWYEITVNDSTDLKYISDRYLESSAVTVSERIGIKTLGDYKIVEAGEPALQASMPMNDPYLGDQWHYFNDGSLSSSVVGSDINLFEAWELNTGRRDVIVSIVDGGIDVTHEDLESNVWVNEVEKNGEPGVDDDNNGYIDDIYGFNFTDFTGGITPHDHGTHVAGTVAAVTNNGVGVSGIAGGTGNNDGVRLMSCQIFGDNPDGYFLPELAILYGADNGAVISQNSWSYIADGVYEQAVLDAIDYFIAEAGKYEGSPMNGGVVIFAAGNSNSDADSYPSYYANTIAVASIGPNYKKAGYSNYGDWVDITAPGGNLYLNSRSGVLSTMPNSSYGYMQGTSMACPHVSGIAALIVSEYGGYDLSNEQLKNRLLTGVNDIDQYNPDYIGKLGTGLIDAAKTLELNNGQAPEQINNLAIVGSSQDFVVLQWNVPVDVDDELPMTYLVYYSEENITEDNLEELNSLVVSNGDKEVGDEMLFEVEGLEKLTTYYFAVEAIDRWGSKSPLSNIVSVKTNEGPEISSDTEQITINIDVNNDVVGTQKFNVLNNKSGYLRWEGLTREVDNKASLTSTTYPVLQNYKSDLEVHASRELVITEAELLAAPADWSPEKKRYFETSYPSYIIGELDTTISNSMATRFYVDNEEGFNLSRVSTVMRLDKVDGPAIVEIYKGLEVNKDNLLYSYTSTDVSDGLMPSGEDDIKYYVHNLKEQLLFEKGDVFWVVYHTPPGNLYPLGIFPEAKPEYSGNCFMSFNNGETWQTIESAAGDNAFVWALEVESTIAPIGDYITLTPSVGQIPGVGQQEVIVDADASELVNGEYNSVVVVESNYTDNPFYRIPVKLNVTGHKPVLNSVAIVNYGMVFNGMSRTISVEVKNLGYGRFKSTSIASSNPDVFKVENSSVNIDALGKENITIEFVPNSVGNFNGVISLTSENGDEYSFNLFGAGIAPAELNITPEIITFDNVDLRDTVELKKTVTISNTGEYPLQYGFPKFADDNSHIEGVEDMVFQKYGYGLASYPYSDDYIFDDISKSGVDLTYNWKSDGNVTYVELDLGFEFPYFGENISKMYVTNRGMLTLGTESVFNATMEFHNRYAPEGYICANDAKFSLSTQGSVRYKKDIGKLIVQYSNVKPDWAHSGNYTFQIVLFDSGDIQIIYDSLDGLSEDDMKYLYAAIENRAKDDGVLVNSRVANLNHVGDKRIVHITSPGNNLIKNVTPAKGTLLPGESQDVDLTLNRERLVEGSHKELISVLSNDPFNRGRYFDVNINVVAGGKTVVITSESNVDYGVIYQNQLVEGTLELYNLGNKSVSIDTVYVENNSAIFNTKSDVELKPKQTMYIDYTVNTADIVTINDYIVIKDVEGKVYRCNILADVVSAPKVVATPDSLKQVLEVNTIANQALTIKNVGDAPLEYSLVGTSLVYPESVNLDGEVEYVYKSTYDEIPVSHNWYIMPEENKLPFFTDEFKDTWYELDLPFSFKFYDKEYSSLWIGMQTAVTFNEPERKDRLLLHPPKLGIDDEFNNIIAPFFQACVFEDYEDPSKSGVFYFVDDEKLIIEWRKFFSVKGVGPPFDRQLILYKDGRIKIQYNTPFDSSFISARDGLVGIENSDATKFEQVSYSQIYAGSGVALEFLPLVKREIAVGESKTVDLTFNSNDVLAGEYTEYLTLSTNDPLNNTINIPSQLTINGEPELLLSDTLDFGEVMITPGGKDYTLEFSITNTGLKGARIKNIELGHGIDAKLQGRVLNQRRVYEWVDLPNIYFGSVFDINPNQNVGLFRIVLTPENVNFIRNGYSNKLTMTTDFGDKVTEFNISADYGYPPEIALDKTEITHVFENDDVIYDKFTISNVNGKSFLDYNLSFDYKRDNVAPTLIEPSNFTGELNLVNRSLVSTGISESASQDAAQEYNRILSHDDFDKPDNAIGLGGDTPMAIAVSFIAPEDGFNLSDIQTWYIPESLSNSPIKVEIRTGSSIDNSVVQYSEVYNYLSDEKDEWGLLLDIPLSEAIPLMPYEKFYVVIIYPSGVAMPQGTVTLGARPADTFLLMYLNKWYDIQSLNDYATTGFMVRVAEKKKLNFNWLQLNEVDGVVNKGEQKEIEISFHPERTREIDNSVILSVSSNDPVNPKVDINVRLRKNQGPEIEVEDNITVYENDTLVAKFRVYDFEGDGVKKVEFNEYDNSLFSFKDDTVSFTYTPTYYDAGIHKFELFTEDNLSKRSTREFYVEVMNVNIAPIVIDSTNIIIDNSTPVYRKRFDRVFMDTDLGNLIYDVQLTGNEDVAKIFKAGDEFIVAPLKTGFTKVKLTAIDEDGEKSTIEKNVVVNSVLSNDEILANKWSIYPNPVEGELVIATGNLEDKSLGLIIYNVNGEQLMSFDAEVENGYLRISVEELSSGVYFIELISNEGRSFNTMLKEN